MTSGKEGEEDGWLQPSSEQFIWVSQFSTASVESVINDSLLQSANTGAG